MHRIRLISLLCAGALTWASGTANSQVNDVSNWKVSCNAEKDCRLGYNIVSSQKLVSRILIYRLGKVEIIEVKLPLGLSHIKPIDLVVDQKKRIPMRILTCKADGCIGYANASKAAIALLKQGGEARLYFSGFDDDKRYHYPFSLSGFTKAYGSYRG